MNLAQGLRAAESKMLADAQVKEVLSVFRSAGAPNLGAPASWFQDVYLQLGASGFTSCSVRKMDEMLNAALKYWRQYIQHLERQNLL